MTTPNGSDDRLAHDDGASADDVADAQFVHGVIEHLEHDHDVDRERRVQSVLSAITATAPSRSRFVFPTTTGIAAAALLIFVLVITTTTPGGTALAVVEESIEAADLAGDRTYAVLVAPPHAEDRLDQIGQIFLRDADHLVYKTRIPNGRTLVVGRNAGAAWAIRPDGSIDEYPPSHVWPRWAAHGERTILVDSVDGVMPRLRDDYELTLLDPASLGDGDAPVFDRVRATLADTASDEPNVVELWIDADTGIVHRMELRWPAYTAPDDAPDRDGARRPPQRGEPRGPGPRGERGGPPPRGERGGPPQHFRPGAPRGERARHFVEGRPDFRGGRNHPPPRLMVFQLESLEALDDSVFEPGRHTRPGS